MIASGLARAAGRRLALVQSASLQACAASVDSHQAACSARGVTKAARKAREANLKAGMAEIRWPAIAPGSRLRERRPKIPLSRRTSPAPLRVRRSRAVGLAVTAAR